MYEIRKVSSFVIIVFVTGGPFSFLPPSWVPGPSPFSGPRRMARGWPLIFFPSVTNPHGPGLNRKVERSYLVNPTSHKWYYDRVILSIYQIFSFKISTPTYLESLVYFLTHWRIKNYDVELRPIQWRWIWSRLPALSGKGSRKAMGLFVGLWL